MGLFMVYHIYDYIWYILLLLAELDGYGAVSTY